MKKIVQLSVITFILTCFHTSFKPVTPEELALFYERLIDLQSETSRQLLRHKYPQVSEEEISACLCSLFTLEFLKHSTEFYRHYQEGNTEQARESLFQSNHWILMSMRNLQEVTQRLQ